jgi:hypothetical protein
MKRLTQACAILSLLGLSNCAGLGAATPTTVDSYCQVYNPVIVEKGDSVITAKIGVKKRLLANEQTYRAQCPK